MPKVYIYDTTLRDGAQMKGISFSVEDKLKILCKLDELGVHFIEGGYPGSNPKDVEFFRRARGVGLMRATLVAFGSTCPKGCRAEEDSGLRALLEVGVSVVTIVGKSWDRHVYQVLGADLEENLRMISQSVAFLKRGGVKVFFDAEHYFDGYKQNPEYALRTLEVAGRAGADCLVLCDTNGGSLPGEIEEGVRAARKATSIPLGIHAHNDSELAVANTLAAVRAGVVQVQGTINGYGERCGNANLCSLIPNLKFKMGVDCIDEEDIRKLTEVSRFVSEVANIPHNPHMPYVGSAAFVHKAGYHGDGVLKWGGSYQHIEPGRVGNVKRVVVSELSGKSNIIYKARELGVDVGGRAKEIAERIKDLESRGFQFDGADASFELLLLRSCEGYKPPFELVDFMVVVEGRRRPSTSEGDILAEATVKVRVGGEVIHTASVGEGPVNALDRALRKALLCFYPELSRVRLVDYKVRILEGSAGTAAGVRVLIESTDGEREWTTVGASTNIIEASWQALTDSLEYWLLKQGLVKK